MNIAKTEPRNIETEPAIVNDHPASSITQLHLDPPLPFWHDSKQ